MSELVLTITANRNQAHSVYLAAFYIDKYEVTNAFYAICVTASVCEPPHFTKSDFRLIYYGNAEFDNCPVIYVDWTRGGDRVIRGGAWGEESNDQRGFYRSWIGPDLSESAIGFRCAESP